MVNSPAFDSFSFQAAIADALNQEFGGSPAAVKRVARLINANERAVRNWFDARNGPSGQHLVMLMHNSPAVVAAVLGLSGQSRLVKAKLAADARDRVRQILVMLDEIADP